MIDNTQDDDRLEIDAGLDEEGESIIPEDDFRVAIAACRLDPELDRYFKFAPPGAKLFIGLGFYSTHFGDKVDPSQYAECQAEIEPALTPLDLKYLIRFERDRNTKKYLRELLARREEELSVQKEQVVADEEASPATPSHKHRRKLPQLDLHEAMTEGRRPRVSVQARIAAMLAVMLGGALAIYIVIMHNASSRSGQPSVVVRLSGDKPVTGTTATEHPSGSGQTSAQELTAKDMEGAAAPINADEEDARIHGTMVTENVASEEMPAPEVESNEVVALNAPIQKPRRRKQMLVFTDGRKIVRRPGGRIEVPRTFSCAGAGIKPFWVYGAHPEAEAAKEMKARAEWQALVRQVREAEVP